MPLDRLHRDKPQFGHSDAGGTKRLQQQQRPLFACVTRCRQQPEILGAGQLPPRVGKNFALPLERFCLAARVMDGFLVHIDAGQQRVDRGGRVAAGRQAVAPGHDSLPRGGGVRRAACRGGALGKKAGQGAGVLLDGGRAVLPVDKLPEAVALYTACALERLLSGADLGQSDKLSGVSPTVSP